MLNPDFPTSGAGVDSLLDPTRNLLTITKGGIYFAIPHDPRYLGAGLFDPTDTGTLVIHLNVTTDGVQDPNASLEGATFTITNTAGTLATITTDAAGHTAAPGLPLGVELTITQTAPAPNSQPAAAQTVTLTPCRPTLISITNTRTSSTGGGYA